MAALIECPKCKEILKEHGDEMKVHTGTYTVNDVYNGENTGSVDDDFVRTIKCNVCDFIGAAGDFR